MIRLTLPWPVSANVYWRTRIAGKHAMTYVSPEAKAFKAEVARIFREAGVLEPITGRVAVEIQLYPARPQDWARRARKAPESWDDDVRSMDLDNANKVLLDALKGWAFLDDKWVRRLSSERMEPDGEARVVVTVTAIRAAAVQGDLLGVAA